MYPALEPPSEAATAEGPAQKKTPRLSWARLLKRVFDLDIERCANCGGALKIIAAIEDPPVIDKILSHLESMGSDFEKLTISKESLYFKV